ncbi:MAG: nucleoside phosphorylase [Gemmatimonadota bacterium]
MESNRAGTFLPNIGVDAGDLTASALVVGDVARVRAAADLLTDIREIGHNREYLTVTGAFEGRRITVASHGVGASGANVCFMELLRGGVRTFIRAGTCGGLDPAIEDGDLIVATGAVREDAVTDHLMPAGYPAIADRGTVESLARAALEERGSGVHVGLVVTDANFYAGVAEPRWKPYVGHGVLGVEMELAGLFVLAAMHGARAGGLLTVDGNLVRDRAADMSDYDPHRPVVEAGKAAMLRAAVRVLAGLDAGAGSAAGTDGA